MIAKENYKTAKTTITNISFNVALLPLLFGNALLTQSVIMGDKITDSGMIYLMVPIYSPILFVASFAFLKIKEVLTKK